MKIKYSTLYLVTTLYIVIAVTLQACGSREETRPSAEHVNSSIKVESSKTAAPSTSVEAQVIKTEQEVFNQKVFQLETAMHAADVSTRDGNNQFTKAREELRILRESIVGKNISNWACVAFQPLGPKDISVELSWSERDGQRTAEVFCSADAKTRFSNRIDENVSHEITLSIYESDAKKIGKVFNNDILTFSGVVEDFSSRGPEKYYMSVYANKVSMTAAK